MAIRTLVSRSCEHRSRRPTAGVRWPEPPRPGRRPGRGGVCGIGSRVRPTDDRAHRLGGQRGEGHLADEAGRRVGHDHRARARRRRPGAGRPRPPCRRRSRRRPRGRSGGRQADSTAVVTGAIRPSSASAAASVSASAAAPPGWAVRVAPPTPSILSWLRSPRRRSTAACAPSRSPAGAPPCDCARRRAVRSTC